MLCLPLLAYISCLHVVNSAKIKYKQIPLVILRFAFEKSVNSSGSCCVKTDQSCFLDRCSVTWVYFIMKPVAEFLWLSEMVPCARPSSLEPVMLVCLVPKSIRPCRVLGQSHHSQFSFLAIFKSIVLSDRCVQPCPLSLFFFL